MTIPSRTLLIFMLRPFSITKHLSAGGTIGSAAHQDQLGDTLKVPDRGLAKIKDVCAMSSSACTCGKPGWE